MVQSLRSKVAHNDHLNSYNKIMSSNRLIKTTHHNITKHSLKRSNSKLAEFNPEDSLVNLNVDDFDEKPCIQKPPAMSYSLNRLRVSEKLSLSRKFDKAQEGYVEKKTPDSQRIVSLGPASRARQNE